MNSPKWFLLLILSLLLAGCGLQARVETVEPVSESLGISQLEIRNCESEEDLHRFLSDDFPVEKTIIISDFAQDPSSGESQLIPEDVRAKLLEQVDEAHKTMHEEAASLAGSRELVVPVNKIRLFRVEVTKMTCSSTLTFNMGLKKYSADYVYELKVPNDPGFWEISCTA
jgi:hypothetical protein